MAHPAADIFYTPPGGFEDVACGELLRSRPIELSFMGMIRQRVDTWQLLFRTTNAKGQPDAAVTTVIVPRSAASGVGADVRLLSYQCAIDAIDAGQFPSYLFRHGASRSLSVPQLEYLLIAAALARGWVVSIPDHEGRQGNWGVADEPGFVILDGVRACVNFSGCPATAETPAALWGYSGGGLASSWAAELADLYAAELNIVGAVLGSPVGDLGNTARRLNGTIFAGLPVVVIAALANEYSAISSIIDQHASTAGKALLSDVATMSTIQALVHFARRDLEDYIDITIDELWNLPELDNVLSAIRLGNHAPAMPLLMVQAVNDPIIDVDDVDAQVGRYRELGTHVTYRRDRLSEHFLLHTISAPLALRWLDDRFNGRPVTADDTRTVWTLMTPAALWGLLRIGLTVLAVCCGLRFSRMSEGEQTPPQLPS